MIKRIIFDLDNTLIIWKNNYLKAIKETTEEYKIKEDYKYISSIIDEYDNIFSKYNKEMMVDFINKKIKDKIDINFLNTFLEKFGYMSDENKEVIDVLKYLSQKYELVVLTNWFKEPQQKRLEKACILKYFKEIYGGEKYMKPNKKAFLMACEKYLPNECLVIGDDYQKDIEGAFNVGINVIYFNYNNKKNNKRYKEIHSLMELKEML